MLNRVLLCIFIRLSLRWFNYIELEQDDNGDMVSLYFAVEVKEASDG